MDLSVITATCQRPEFLSHCLHQFAQQSRGGLECEHLVISDGPDGHAKFLAERAGARYFELNSPAGQWGAVAKDLGITQAYGRYVCFWDDDNIFEPHALVSLFAAVQNVEIGIVRTRHRFRKSPGSVVIPRNWRGEFRLGDIDTMCLCVETTLARKEPWESEVAKISNDYEWLMKLMTHQPKFNYLPILIGQHV